MEIIKCKNNSDIQNLYDKSALTWVNRSIDDNSLQEIVNWFTSNGCPLREEVCWLTSGKQMNRFCNIKKSIFYPDNANIISIELDNITNASKILSKRMEFGARWFDDIVNQNKINN